MKNEIHNPAFKFGSKVRITKGFYRDRKGTVIDYFANTDGDVTGYSVRFGWSWFGFNENYQNISALNLELA